MITEESFIDFKCPYCGDPVSFPGDNAGSIQACPSCTESLIVPDDGNEVAKRIPIPIATPRLVLRRFAPGDWKDLLECLSDPEIFQYLEGGPWEEEEVLRWLERESHVKLTTPDQTVGLGIELQEGPKLIGHIGLQLVDLQHPQATFNIVLNRKYQRKGLALEAIKGLLGFCFEGLKLHRVSARCDPRNLAACKLMEATGFRREGELIKDRYVKEEWVNTVCYAVLAEEYRKSKPAQA